MKTLLKNLWLTGIITGVMVIGNWMWCVYVDHWNPNNMSLDWSDHIRRHNLVDDDHRTEGSW